MAAKLEALANQINPHFLFNTLTSISSLIRSQPETARMLIVKLSALLRRLLRTQEHFVTLREELDAVGEYLDIERVRFGSTLVVEQQYQNFEQNSAYAVSFLLAAAAILCIVVVSILRRPER